jgi:hypothetical protein
LLVSATLALDGYKLSKETKAHKRRSLRPKFRLAKGPFWFSCANRNSDPTGLCQAGVSGGSNPSTKIGASPSKFDELRKAARRTRHGEIILPRAGFIDVFEVASLRPFPEIRTAGGTRSSSWRRRQPASGLALTIDDGQSWAGASNYVGGELWWHFESGSRRDPLENPDGPASGWH